MLLQVENLVKRYGESGRPGNSPGILALDSVSLEIPRGSVFGLIGESGSGKSTLARCILGLEQASGGRILFDGVDITHLSHKERRKLSPRIQIVHQDPYASLNPRMTVHDIVAEPLVIHRRLLGESRAVRSERVAQMLETVQLGTQHIYRYPHELSGGQRQRIGIARALALDPSLLILDEPTSALDVSVQAQILNLLCELQERLGLSYLMISHDVSVVRYMSDTVALLHHGKMVETGPTEQVLDAPCSEYARMLIAAVPEIDVGPPVPVATLGVTHD